MNHLRIAAPLLAVLLATPAAFAGGAAATPSAAVPQSMVQTVADDSTSGMAAWYGGKFAGRKTASGQRFNPGAMTAAHGSLPFGTKVRVTNLKNKRSVVLTINDRLNSSAGRVIDVSRGAAQRLGFVKAGLAEVRIERMGR